jgi:hypothetical protein
MRSAGGRTILRAVAAALLCASLALAGPPFLTDDPEPVDLHHYEFYVFSTLDRSFGVNNIAGPAFELNYGAAPNLQLHIIAPLAVARPDRGATTAGMGDIELGVKYRFVQEKRARPQIGVFPMLEVPSGDAARGLGNGKLWARLPLWVQKSWGPESRQWMSYGGGGYVVNRAPGMRDHPFFGWLVQRDVAKRLTLGGEWFNPGRELSAGRNTHLANAGGIYKFTERFNLLFTAGHSVAGDRHTVAYLALYWTWGPEEQAAPPALSSGRAMPPGLPALPPRP